MHHAAPRAQDCGAITTNPMTPIVYPALFQSFLIAITGDHGRYSDGDGKVTAA
jgi:hypothetical protein